MPPCGCHAPLRVPCPLAGTLSGGQVIMPLDPVCKKLTDTPIEKAYLQLIPDMLSSPIPGDVAQLGERDNRTVEVRGSSPLISTVTILLHFLANRKDVWYS